MKEMVFETIEGYRIIGIPVKPPKQFLNKLDQRMDYSDGIWINRTRLNRVTFLDKSSIIRVRPITLFDTEYDPPLGIGKEE